MGNLIKKEIGLPFAVNKKKKQNVLYKNTHLRVGFSIQFQEGVKKAAEWANHLFRVSHLDSIHFIAIDKKCFAVQMFIWRP